MTTGQDHQLEGLVILVSDMHQAWLLKRYVNSWSDVALVLFAAVDFLWD